jgi:hypothetical protein
VLKVSITITLCSAAAVAGCGQASTPGKTQSQNALRRAVALTERGCLKNAGFTFARHPGDIAFFVRDRRAGQAQKPGGTFLHKLRVVVEEWQHVPDASGGLPRWVLWTAQPIAPGHPAAPDQLLARGGSGYYVAYIRRPTTKELDAGRTCLKRVQGTRG